MKKNALEWTVFGISAALIAATVVILLHAHVTSAQRPPLLVVHLGEPMARGDGFAVPLEVSNEGDTTAAGIRIEVTLSGQEGEERSEVELAFVPRGSRRRAWVAFDRFPAGALRARVLGYEEP